MTGSGSPTKHSFGVLKREFNSTLLFVAIFGTFGSMTFAYDGGWWGNALGHPAFTAYYGSLYSPTLGRNVLTPVQQSCGTALGTAGIMIGCMIQTVLGRKLGRKNMLILLAIIACIGSIIQITSVIGDRDGPTKFWQLVAGKIIVNSSVGIATTVVPPYLAEVSPTAIRGFMVTCHNVAEIVGGLLANATVFGMQNRTDRLPWMLPIGLQMVIPVLMILGSPLLPESPRWLVEVGRDEEAVKSVNRLRQGQTDAAAEVAQIRESIRHHEEMTGGVTWRSLFLGTDRRRTLITIAMTCLQQAQGISFINNYLVITLISVGVTSPITYSFILSACQFVIMLSVGAYVPDRFGRRPLLLGGAAMMGTALFSVGSISAATNNAPPPPAQRAYIAMFFVWVFSFATSWGPLSWTTMAETPSAALREKSVGIGAWSGFAVGMCVNFIQPYLNAAIGGRSAFVYAVFSPIAIAYVWFFLPELKGRSLEQIDEMFDARVPTRKFATYVCTRGISPAGDVLDEANRSKRSLDKVEDAQFVEGQAK